MIKACAAALLAAMWTTFAAAQAPAPLQRLPVEAFARPPLLQSAALSPDGKRLAAIVPVGDDTFVAVREVDGAGKRLQPIYKSDDPALRLSEVRWVNNERLVVSLRFPGRARAVDFAETRLVTMLADGTQARLVVDTRTIDRDRRHLAGNIQDRVIDWMPDDGRHVLMVLHNIDVRGSAVYRIALASGERKVVHGDDGHFWWTDATHRVRVSLQTEQTLQRYKVCDPDGTRWRVLHEADMFGADAMTPLGFGRDPNLLYVLTGHEGRRAAFEIDLRTDPPQRRLLVSDPAFDLNGELIVSPRTGRAVGLRTSRLGDSSTIYWDEDYKAFVRDLDRALPGRFNRLLQVTEGEARYLVLSSGNGIAPELYLGDTARGSLDLLARLHPQLAPERMARKQAVTIKARDGLALPSYLTLPPGGPDKALPTVVLPHGGPYDSLDFDAMSQFLASRGYAVLQPNFRGSAGFGHELLAAGVAKWGLEMQDDLTDATRWLIERGVTDPRRICIVGGSYGGYAALMGAAKTPELYRCAVSLSGVSDLAELVVHARNFGGLQPVLEKQIGALWADRERLRETSPRRLAERVRAPVLLLHGSVDSTVPPEHSRWMAEALQAAAKPVRHVVLDGADHALSRTSHRVQFYSELERFLAEHLAAAPAGR